LVLAGFAAAQETAAFAEEDQLREEEEADFDADQGQKSQR
jgi:hypothetical protein